MIGFKELGLHEDGYATASNEYEIYRYGELLKRGELPNIRGVTGAYILDRYLESKKPLTSANVKRNTKYN